MGKLEGTRWEHEGRQEEIFPELLQSAFALPQKVWIRIIIRAWPDWFDETITPYFSHTEAWLDTFYSRSCARRWEHDTDAHTNSIQSLPFAWIIVSGSL